MKSTMACLLVREDLLFMKVEANRYSLKYGVKNDIAGHLSIANFV